MSADLTEMFREICLEDPDFDEELCSLLEDEAVFVAPRSQGINITAPTMENLPGTEEEESPWENAGLGEVEPGWKIKPNTFTKNLGSKIPKVLGKFTGFPGRDEEPADEEEPPNGAEYPPATVEETAGTGGWWKVGALVAGAVALFVIGKEIGG